MVVRMSNAHHSAQSEFSPQGASVDRRNLPPHGLRHPCRRRAARPPLRKLAHPPVSLANQRLAQGLAIVPAEGNRSLGYRAVKRLLDIVGTLAVLSVLGPVMAVVFLTLLVTTRGKPLYWQRRAGYCGRPFWMAKFRTMAIDADQRKREVVNEKDGPIFKNRRDPRITRIGRILRKTSLDETPQLFHVLFGQMTLVGPRPLPVSEVAQFEPWHRRRLTVVPGLTCLWQVSGRSEIGFEDWIRLDIWYVRNQSFRTDCDLLLRTPWAVLTGQGAY